MVWAAKPAAPRRNAQPAGGRFRRAPDATIDLKSGERLPIAIARTEKFVDDALRESRSAVFVLHGHGTGILPPNHPQPFSDFPGVRSARPLKPTMAATA